MLRSGVAIYMIAVIYWSFPQPGEGLTMDEGHFVRCLVNISVGHFTPGHSLLLSLPPPNETNNEVEVQLLKHLQEVDTWPVVMFPFKDPDENREVIHPDGSFIILVKYDCNDKKPWYEKLYQQIEDLIIWKKCLVPVWSHKAKFVIAVNVSCSHLNHDEIILELLELVWEFKIINVIILVSIATQSKDPKNMPVYSFFMYDSKRNCSRKVEPEILDTWIMEDQGHFLTNSDLFPEKVSKDLNGCALIAITRAAGQYLIHIYDRNNPKKLKGATGFEMNIFINVAEALNATVRIHPLVESFNGDVPDEGDVIDAFNNNTADVAIGALTLLNPWAPFTTTKGLYGSFHWAVPCHIMSPRAGRIFKLFSFELWIAVVLIIVLASFTRLYLANKDVNPGIIGATSEIWAVILGVSVSAMPRTPALRIFFLSWVCFSLAFNMVFQSFFVTFLVEPGYEPQIRNMDELMASGLKFTFHPAYGFLYQHSIDSHKDVILERTVECSDIIDDCFEWAARFKNAAIILTQYNFQQRYSKGELLDENYKTRVCKLDDGIIMSKQAGMLVPKGHPLFVYMNHFITRIMEGGLHDFWLEMYLHLNKIDAHAIGIPSILGKYYSFNMIHLMPQFIVLLIGYSISALVFILELVLHRCKCKDLQKSA